MRPATWPWQVKRENGIWDSSSTWTEKPSEPFKKSGNPVEVLAQCRASCCDLAFSFQHRNTD
jgi:hypothetical protein